MNVKRGPSRARWSRGRRAAGPWARTPGHVTAPPWVTSFKAFLLLLDSTDEEVSGGHWMPHGLGQLLLGVGTGVWSPSGTSCIS